MSKIFRRSNCQKASDGTDGVNRWRYRRHFGRADRLATPGAVHIRLLEGYDPPIRCRGWDDPPLDSPRLFREPLDEGRGVEHLPARLRKRFALFRCHNATDVVDVGRHQVVPALQDCASLACGATLPGGPRGTRRFNGYLDIHSTHLWNRADQRAVRRIPHVNAIATLDPLTVDQVALHE